MADDRTTIVFHSENSSAIGGSDFYMGRLMDGLDRRCWRVGLLVRRGYPLDQITARPHEVEVRYNGCPLEFAVQACGTTAIQRPADLPARDTWWGRAWSWTPRAVRRDVGLVREIGQTSRCLLDSTPGLFHTMDGGPQPAVLGAVRSGYRAVVSYCAPPPQQRRRGVRRWLERSSCRWASARIVKSDFARQAWANYLNCPPDWFQVIPNGIDAVPYRQQAQEGAVEFRRELNLPADAIVVGMTGRLETEKGIDVLVTAIPELARDNSRLYFVITGEGTRRAAAQAALRSAGVDHRVRLLGFRHDIPRTTAAYDIAVVPSVWDEPFGWVVLEAMAAGKPVVASNVGGIPEIVRDQETGLLIPPGRPAELAQAVLELAGQEQRCRRLGQQGYRRLCEHFSAAQMIDRTRAIYEQCAATTTIRPINEMPQNKGTVSCGIP